MALCEGQAQTKVTGGRKTKIRRSRAVVQGLNLKTISLYVDGTLSDNDNPLKLKSCQSFASSPVCLFNQHMSI